MNDVKISLHELNKTVIEKFPPISKESELNLKKMVYDLSKDKEYMMLISREKYDFTLFVIKKDRVEYAKNVMEVLKSRGEIKDYGKQEYSDALEIWVDSDLYLLFDYSVGVIES